MELVGGGELFDRLAARGAYAEDDAAIIMAELCDALAYLHGLGVVHRDVKPENICFATRDDNAATRLIGTSPALRTAAVGNSLSRFPHSRFESLTTDFGYAAVLAIDGSRARELGPSGYCGTTRYLAPEQLKEGAADTVAHDMWAAGVVLYILLCGFPPFTAQVPQLFDDIQAARYSFPSPEWDSVSEEAKALVRGLLVLNPEKRLTAEQVAESQWVVTCAGVLADGLDA